MSDNIKIPLELDTRPAKAGMRDLKRAKNQTRRKLNTAAAKRRPISSNFGFAAGFVSALSLQARIARAHSGTVDPWTEAMVPIMAAAQQGIDSAVGFSAVSRKRAREDSAERFATSAYEMGTTKHAKDYYRGAVRIATEEEEGRNILRQDSRFLGPGLGELLAQAVPGYVTLIFKSVEYMIERIKS